ncbi:MAG: metallophosphoesterase [Steroidobacteraceae bacterium]|nr:metallophosphoesterase [Steroidobacteraceae bacterium]
MTGPGIPNRHGRVVRIARILLASVALISPIAPASSGAQQVEWKGVERVVAFADVHGAYSELTALLQSQGIVDGDLRWSAGKTHLVSLGDLLDRGDDSRKVMDLLMRLQTEAAASGGQVHVVVGNHEAMNVLGDLRYVVRGEYASYIEEEDPVIREARRKEFLARQPGRTEAEFDKLFPPGYFGQRSLLGPEGLYGRWLLAQPVAIVVNDTVYMHGGPSLALGNRSIAELDRDYAAAVNTYLAAEASLVEAGLLVFEDSYAQRARNAQARLDAMPPGEAKSARAPQVARFAQADDDPLIGSNGPNWYRGAALCNECAEADVLRPFLHRAGVQRVVVGHTVARNGTAVSRFDGAVVKLDAGMNKAVYHGRPAALISDASGSRVAYANPTVAPASVPAEPLYLSSPLIDEDAVAAILRDGQIETTEACGQGVLRVRVTRGGHSIDAVFEATSTEVTDRELAAYALDRLLGLGLVPATVSRSYSGQDGVLQGRPAAWASQQDRQNAAARTAAGLACQVISNNAGEPPIRRPLPLAAVPPRLSAGGYCDLNAQFQLSYAFDALIGNQARTQDRYLYDLDPSMQARGMSLVLSGHGSSFGTSTKLPPPLETALAKTGPEMQSRLRQLDAAAVKSAIGQWVGDQEIRALLTRRDRILELARGSN